MEPNWEPRTPEQQEIIDLRGQVRLLETQIRWYVEKVKRQEKEIRLLNKEVKRLKPKAE